MYCDKKIPFVILILLTLVSCSRKAIISDAHLYEKISTDIRILADDAMEGREIGTNGEKKAAEYIVSRYQQIGLQPKGDDGLYLQSFSRKLNRNPHGDEAQNSVAPEVTGKNILGYIDNQATNTVIIGAHYDHLGYGHEGSLYVGDRAIHNGADDNASGVSGLLYLAEAIKASNLKNNNYLFICFSGEEKGLWGSNYFVNHTTLDKTTFNYMLNMDMIGRLNSERKLAISGIGTSPLFDRTIDNIKNPVLSIKKDSSGLGPSDHASFYNSGIPVLAFFTGQHSDYHKPSDDHQFINLSGTYDVSRYMYEVVRLLDKESKLPFLKTRDESQTRMAFTVTLGVMPDYLYDGKGLKIDGVKDGKPAAIGGIQKGDIVIKMGALDIPDMQAYMKCLSLFKPGQTVDVVFLRDGKEISQKITF